MHGQNAFLTVTLFGGGILLLDPPPILAGALLGTNGLQTTTRLSHPARFARLRALDGDRRRIRLGCLARGCVLRALRHPNLCRLPCGDRSRSSRLEDGLVDWDKMESLFAGVRLLGGSLVTAYAAQALLALGRCRRRYRCVARACKHHGKGSGCSLSRRCCFSVSTRIRSCPTGNSIAWLTWDGARNGFLPWEKASLALAWLVPLASRPIASLANLGIAPLVCGLLLVTALRRALRESRVQKRTDPRPRPEQPSTG